MCREYTSFIDIFKYRKEHDPEKTAIITGDETRTYGQIYENARKIAGLIRLKGILPGESVAIISQNSADYVETVLGCVMSGSVPVLINWRLAAPEMHYLLIFNEVKLIIYRALNDTIRHEVGEFMGRHFPAADMDRMESLVKDIAPLEKVYEHSGEEVLMHLHTSGTTGTPKTVRYSSREYMRELNSCIHTLGFKKDSVFQLMSQMFHSASIGPYSVLACGGTVVMFPKFSPDEYLSSIEKHRVTRLSAIPTVLTAMLNHLEKAEYDLSSLELISYSTCPMPPALIRRAIERLHCGFLQCYGMTEMGSIVTILTPEDHLKENMRYLNSVGRPIEGHEVRIVDEEGRECPPGVTGEIVTRGPGMMIDYYKMPDETKEAVLDGWYHTKDMGYLDEDGYLYISGRKNDMIISGGENIFPLEIEKVLRLHEEIADVYVLGVPDDYWGESVRAVVIRKEGSQVDQEQIRNFCRGRIAGYKIPKNVYFCQEFPKTATGKVCKADVLKFIKEIEQRGNSLSEKNQNL